MKCKWLCKLITLIVVFYAADTIYPDWDSSMCSGKEIQGIHINPSDASEKHGRGFKKPVMDGCIFKADNRLRNFID